jgi:hypothetical protein
MTHTLTSAREEEEGILGILIFASPFPELLDLDHFPRNDGTTRAGI